MCHDTISKEWKVHNKTAVQNSRLPSFLFVVFLVVIFSTFCGRWGRMKDVAMMIIYIPSTLLTVSNFTFCYEKWEGAVTKEQKRNHLMLFKIKMLSFCFCNLLQFCQFVTQDFSHSIFLCSYYKCLFLPLPVREKITNKFFDGISNKWNCMFVVGGVKAWNLPWKCNLMTRIFNFLTMYDCDISTFKPPRKIISPYSRILISNTLSMLLWHIFPFPRSRLHFTFLISYSYSHFAIQLHFDELQCYAIYHMQASRKKMLKPQALPRLHV